MKRQLICTLTFSAQAAAQSLTKQGPWAFPEDINGNAMPSESPGSACLSSFPAPKRLEMHDLVTIIVNETSRAERSQSLENKEYSAAAELSTFPSLAE